MAFTVRSDEILLRQLVAVSVDVGKPSAMVMACNFTPPGRGNPKWRPTCVAEAAHRGPGP